LTINERDRNVPLVINRSEGQLAKERDEWWRSQKSSHGWFHGRNRRLYASFASVGTRILNAFARRNSTATLKNNLRRIAKMVEADLINAAWSRKNLVADDQNVSLAAI